MKKNKKILISIVLLIIILTIPLWVNSVSKEELTKISYNEFIKLIEEEKVEEVIIDFSSEIFIFKDIEGENFKTDNPRNIDFKKFLLENDIEVSVISISPNVIFFEILFGMLRIAFIFVIFGFVMKKTGMNIFKKEKSEISVVPNVKFQNIAGNIESKSDMQFLVNFLKNPKKYYDMGAKLPKGVVLYGPPGTGKTLTAKAIAGEAGVPFLSVSGSDFVEMYVGLGAKRVRNLFQEAKKKAPCIIFIDEIDAIGTNRGKHGGNSEKDQTINALLAELDGFESNESIIVIVATNRVEDLDPALIRHGRFDKHIAINLPEYNDRFEILKKYSENKKLANNINLNDLAKITIGFSGASLEALMNEATILAVNRGSSFVEKRDIDDAYFKMIMRGHKKENKEIDEEELKLIAYHEAGHALCAKLLTNNSVPKVTIIPSTSGTGGVTFNIPKKMNLFSKNEILNNIKVLYAGRAAEYVLKNNENEITTGASQDIKQATKYIKKYFNDYGMSEEFGLIRISDINGNNNLIMNEAIKLSKKLYNETLEILIKNKDRLKKIAEELMVKETLSEDDLNAIINKGGD